MEHPANIGDRPRAGTVKRSTGNLLLQFPGKHQRVYLIPIAERRFLLERCSGNAECDAICEATDRPGRTLAGMTTLFDANPLVVDAAAALIVVALLLALILRIPLVAATLKLAVLYALLVVAARLLVIRQ